MEQERIMEISSIEKDARQLEENLQIIEAQVMELEAFKITIEALMKTKQKEMLASIGSRVYFEANIVDIEKLFVEVGAGVVVKKTPSDTLAIVNTQLSRLKEIRLQMKAQLEEDYQQLQLFVEEMNKG